MKNTLDKAKPFLILNAVIGIAIIILIIFDQEIADIKSTIKRDTSKEFSFVSPILDCEAVEPSVSYGISSGEFRAKADALANEYNVFDYSIYFRDLNNGPWLGINEKEFFSPASLMKTPLLIAFLKNVERNPELLNKEIIAKDEYFLEALNQNFEVGNEIIRNKKYRLEQVAMQMISESDNVAMLMLTDYVLPEDLIDLLQAIGAIYKEPHQDSDIRVKDFAGFFRVLYNASYLGRDMSELALSMLAKSSFTSGIVAGVPQEVIVAHKYGERSIDVGNNQDKQLHDCGIIYANPDPYILCIMTKGKDFERQQAFISGISKYFYETKTK